MKQYKLIFFDFDGVLFSRIGGEWVYNKSMEPLLLQDPEIPKGVLCNLPQDITPASVRLMLKAQAAEALFDARLFIFPQLLGVSLPDARAFAMAAAVGGVAINEIAFVTADAGLLAASGPVIITYEQPPVPGLMAVAGEKKTRDKAYVLRGRIVTMDNGKIINDGSIIVEEGRISQIIKGADIPDEFKQLPVIDTGSTLYPGLIDLHNHYPYNIISLWNVPKKYNNRTTWFREPSYKTGVSLPVTMLAKHTPTAKAIARFVEAKAIMGGTCTGQGIARNKGGGIKMYRGAMRNVESGDEEGLPEVNAQVLDLKVSMPTEIEKFRRNLNRYSAMFYHLSEGTDEGSRKRFLELKQHKLIKASLVGIHSLALQPQDIDEMAQSESKIVWSPFSNLLLYGSTLQLKPLVDSGILFSIGCDWSPSGGKNLLMELKIARFMADSQNAGISNQKLIEMVTSDAAQVLGWQEHLGTLADGAVADVVAVKGQTGDAYQQLIEATEHDIALVIVGGVARYGDIELMQEMYGKNSKQLEKFNIGRSKKGFYLFADDSEINDLGLAGAVETLTTAMSDLPATQADIESARPSLFAMEEEFTLALDMEEEEEDALPEPSLFATLQMPESVPLDTLSVQRSDLDVIAAEGNLPRGLAAFIEQFYET